MNKDERWEMFKDSVEYERTQQGHDQLKGWFLTMGSSMLLIAIMFAIVFGVFAFGGCSSESDEDPVSQDLKYSEGRDRIPYAEGLVPHYTALDGTIWYDGAGNRGRDKVTAEKRNLLREEWSTINHHELRCKHCHEINFFPAHKIKKPCDWCGKLINNTTKAG